jgi:hypothetical protein
MQLPIYELKINDSLQDDSEVSFIALVDLPAIKKDFLAFKEEFIQPSKGEHETDFLPRCISYVVNEGKDNEQAVAICNSLWEQHFEIVCPVATHDIATNLKDRQNAIDIAHYGPLNPNLPNEEYWTAKGKQFNTTAELAKQSRCANCSFFNVSQAIKDCIATGIGNELDPYEVIKAGDLGYCEAFDFKCASARTCDAWVAGGPISLAGGVSFDFDGVLTTSAGIKKLDESVSRGTNIYIVSARQDDKGLKEFASKHNVPLSNVFATGSNKAKVEKVKALGVSKHIDNNPDVIKELGSIGEKFQFIGFQVVNEDEHIISGPLMLAEELIYRNNEKFGEHYVKFSADTIKSIAIKFSKKGFQANVNLMHDPEQKVKGVTMFESFLTDKKRGILPMAGFENVADGSWFGSFYVENPEVWSAIKSGEYRGFSVEGLFDYEEPITHEMMLLKRIENLLNEIN